ncbi:MAG: glycoside hydrolase family 3 C-terminal domain-containing protein [Oscillospiraceae bacterium]|nr:glycoside hydrolase family 3 C-terminal domain-containing protein [Oscillospiraceae bacterium]
MALSRRLAGECVVLMENDGTLPLKADGKLALYGNGARQTVKGGTGSGDVYTRSSVNIEQGLENAGFTVTTKSWLDRQTEKHALDRKKYSEWVQSYAAEKGLTDFFVSFSYPFLKPSPAEITQQDITASDTDTAVYVIARISGEGADRKCERGDYLLYDEEKSQLEMLCKAYKKVIVVLNIGGVMDMSELKGIGGINAIVLMSQLGSVSGDALADVLTGKTTPSGKLTDTWAKQYSDYPSSETFSSNDGDVDDEYYSEGIFVGYRYFDTFGTEPLYPFGYGRSYTDFSIDTDSAKIVDGKIKVTVTVKNTGTVYPGKEVVQVYYSAPKGKLPKPRQELAAFAKTKLLSPGESETLEITFDVRDMDSYCEDCAAWVLEKGDFFLRVGNSSADTKIAAVLELDDTVKTEQLKNLFADTDPVKEIEPPKSGDTIINSETERIVLSASEISTRQVTYQEGRKLYTTDKTETLTADHIKSGKCTVEELTAQLTVEEMAELCVGTLRDDGSVIGNASYVVPGAAGDTSSILMETRGIKNMILADGPAGLRLQPVFKTTKDGKLLPGGEGYGEGAFAPFSTEYTEENSDTYYQYCTAVPIGWALAHSWDMPLLEEIGSMVGEEMEQFGVDLWLAPAMNIHRDPLCGRNFEYYSEDPLISGKAAAAITRGVQKHKGKGTTIKHFAANNQENNRYFSNSHVSERAMREIYLKGFEIAVRESQPMSIMTSYNLLNGIHTANSYDLIQSAARDEWGFEGVIMTDWFTSQYLPPLTGNIKTKYFISASTGCIKAGNDIQMPGCRKNADDIIKAVKTGEEADGYKLTLADLQFNAANVIRIAVKTGI